MAGPSIGADWEPSGDLKLQIGFGAGGSTDTMGRVLAKVMEEQSGWNIVTENKPPNEFASNFPMYNTLGSYAVSIPGLPSDTVVGLGLGSIEQPDFKVHTNFFLTFKRVTR